MNWLVYWNDGCQLSRPYTIFSPVKGVLGNIYLSLHRLGLNSVANNANDLNATIKVAADLVSSGLLNRLRRSILWVKVADRYAHSTLLEAYTIS